VTTRWTIPAFARGATRCLCTFTWLNPFVAILCFRGGTHDHRD
jgi:hypothetical protein